MQSAAPPDLSDTPYRLLERTAHGEFGSWRAVDEDGNRFVVKPTWTEDGVEATELLRTDGVPVPRYVLLRAGLSVQEELPGMPLAGWEQLAPRTAERAIELTEHFIGKRVSNAPPWPERIHSDVLVGHHYVDLPLLRQHASNLLARCQRAVRVELDDPGDLVHWDYTTANILAVDGEITGVVDWDGVCNGDRLFDLVTLFYYTRTPLLREYVLERTSERVFSAYLAAMIVRQTAFSLKFHDAAAGLRLIADGLELSEAFPA